jgi:lambda repressor-like predicted transcriptional regulator
MEEMREIGRRLQAEQGLTADDIAWLVAIARAILRAFIWDEGQPMRALADTLGVSPTTLYSMLRLAVGALVWVRRHKESVATVVEQVRALQERLTRMEQAYAAAQAQVQSLKQALTEVQSQVTHLEAKMIGLQAQWLVMQDRLIVVLKLSGRCTVRSIVEVLKYGLGIHVSVGYVQGIITQAGLNAHTALGQMLEVVSLSGAICVDEVFLKELGRKMLGVVIVDPLSGLILCLQRCSERSKEAIGEVLQQFAAAGFQERIKLCVTDMYTGYLGPVKTYLPKAVHQFCWFHLNCFHIGARVHRARRAYEKAVEALAAFDQKRPAPLSPAEQQQRQALVAAQDQAQRHWQGAQRFQRMLLGALWLPTLDLATARLDRLIRVAAKVKNPYINEMGTFLADHRAGLLVFYSCLESSQHTLKRISRSQQQWVTATKRWAIPITSNAAEHVFRCFRRYTHQMDHFGTPTATQCFFDLFAFYHNVHTLRAGKRAGRSLLAAAYTEVKALFGTDDPYTILGFPPASQSFALVKSVQSTAA